MPVDNKRSFCSRSEYFSYCMHSLYGRHSIKRGVLDFTFSRILCQFQFDIAEPNSPSIAKQYRQLISHNKLKIILRSKILPCMFWKIAHYWNNYPNIQRGLQLQYKSTSLCQWGYISQLLFCQVFRSKYRYFLVIE